ncbi:MAG: hypothetical protein MPW15_06445 [Candidatus Manganitrophus sp.]|nr:hypothetical protein [Candidatus Manganitrophus sp.]
MAEVYFEIGPVFTYAKIEDDDGSSPAEIYFLPDLPATPFITGSILSLGGDLGEVFDDERSFGAGIKIFVAESAALRITGTRITVQERRE